MLYNNEEPVYALIDCNQFYVSCERAFAPYLENEPVGVLSNNDGCLVALSPELKRLGVSRGMPCFKIKEIVGNKKVYLFSSNYELYGDMSSRVMKIISSMADDIEIYSIDEAFLLFKNIHQQFNIYEYAKQIKIKVKNETSIPVSIGLAKTKTLAKVANKIAKQSKEGIFDLTHKADIDKILSQVDINDIWGVGNKYSKKLNRYGIYTALDFINAPDYFIRKEMSVVGERTQMELKGIPCIEIESVTPKPKSIVCSRSFGKPVSEYNEMLESVSLFCSKAVKSLRRKKQVAKTLTVYVTTNPFKDTKQYANFIQGSLLDYSAYTPDFIILAKKLLEKIFKENYLYKKSGVMLTDIISENNIYPNLFGNSYGNDNRHEVMNVLDKINHKYGKDKLFFASSGVKNNWTMKRELVSPRYTTRWAEIAIVKAK